MNKGFVCCVFFKERIHEVVKFWNYWYGMMSLD
jgi:hypothetical protein